MMVAYRRKLFLFLIWPRNWMDSTTWSQSDVGLPQGFWKPQFLEIVLIFISNNLFMKQEKSPREEGLKLF